jgi:two-component system CheB/CheR fusion protein
LSRMEPSSPQLSRLQSIFDRQTLQTTKLIDGLLDVSRVARGKVELQITPVNASELARQVADDRRHELGARNLDVRVPPGELWVAADRVRLVQILNNLLSNAIKFTGPAGRIVIGLERKGERGLVRVSDDGIGIESELLPQIFEPFRQGRSAAQRARGGLGLGLALVKGLVDLHRFELNVYSAGAGRGASFELEFPLTAAPAERPPESQVETRPLTLLLVEDNVDIADTLAELLTDAGHQIEVARSAEDALLELKARRPDIVLCDIGLPGMDGLTLATRLREDPDMRDLKLIAMTGYGDASTRACIERAGFDRYLIKPVQLTSLQHSLRRLAAAPAQWINRR